MLDINNDVKAFDACTEEASETDHANGQSSDLHLSFLQFLLLIMPFTDGRKPARRGSSGLSVDAASLIAYSTGCRSHGLG